MLYLVIWWLIGLVSLFVVVLKHFMEADSKGYDVMVYWEEKIQDDDKGIVGFVKFFIGLTIWPVRVYEFVSCIPDLYEQYELLYKK